MAEASGAAVAALVQATTARLARVADLAAELDGLRLAFPALMDATCGPGELAGGLGALVLRRGDAGVPARLPTLTLEFPPSFQTRP